MEQLILPLVLLAFIAFREQQTARERQSLLDRLMARDLSEYKALEDAVTEEEQQDQDDTIAIEEAEEELVHGEEE